MKLSILSIASLGSVVAAQGYFSTCTTWWLSGEEMYADCWSESGTLITSHEALNLCISNQNGQLVAADDGFFYNSCSECGPVFFNGDTTLSSEMECLCTKADGTSDFSIIDLNAFVSNSNGLLVCFGNIAAEVD
ncbi:Cyanovirin-N [Xylariales sp. PMI_506]|nr:Cyanovirin-N [Xylariales sp. PMI_506]